MASSAASSAASYWRPVARLPAAAFTSATKGDLHACLGGFPAVVDLSDADVKFHPLSNMTRTALLTSLKDVRVDVRTPIDVARSGGAFRLGQHSPRPSVSEWLRGGGLSPLIFDTLRGSELHTAVQQRLGMRVPTPLRSWSRSPIATIGRTSDCNAVESAEGPHGGLAFHRHERNWLYLACGIKRWFFHVGGRNGTPVTAYERVREEELRQREAAVLAEEKACFGDSTMALFVHDQLPGECVLLPDGLWHCTYNVSQLGGVEGRDNVTFGVGGMGSCVGDTEFFAAQGNVGWLQTALADRHLEAPEAFALARIAAEQAQPAVLVWLNEVFGIAPLLARDTMGATPLHFATAAGSVEAVTVLLEVGADVGEVDIHGTTPVHWTCRSGSADVLAKLFEAGADLEAEDEACGCRPLHLLASSGHVDAVRWAVEVARVDAFALDRNGRSPADWANSGGHVALADWLSRK